MYAEKETQIASEHLKAIFKKSWIFDSEVQANVDNDD